MDLAGTRVQADTAGFVAFRGIQDIRVLVYPVTLVFQGLEQRVDRVLADFVDYQVTQDFADYLGILDSVDYLDIAGFVELGPVVLAGIRVSVD